MRILPVIMRKYDAYANRAIRRIKRLPPESRQSGDDSGLEDVWEEFKSQIQHEQSIFFDLYEQVIRELCLGLVQELPGHEIEILWFGCEARFDCDDDEAGTHPLLGELRAHVADELYRIVCRRAADEAPQSDLD
jgi:hypothetical protein